MNRKQKIIVSITGIILVSLILIGLTYAYFLTKITGNTNSKSISVTTANLELVYGDGNGILAPTDKLMPGDTVGTKEFTVTNNGNNKVEGYLVIFRDVTNTLLRPEDLVYKVECKQYLNDVETGTCDGVEYETQLPTGTGSGSGVIVSNDIEAGYVQKYKLTLDYLNPDVDQSDDMNKTIEAKIDIMDVKLLNSEKGITNYASDTLAGTIINNSIANKNGTELVGKYNLNITKEKDFKYVISEEQTPDDVAEVTPDANTVYTYSSTYEVDEGGYIILTNAKTGKFSEIYQDLVGKYIICEEGDASSSACKNELSSKINWIEKVTETTETTLKANVFVGKATIKNKLNVISDNDGISYFYRGNVKDNYINFDDKCWRIIRIEGDGSIKMILDDNTNTCESSSYNPKNGFIVPSENTSKIGRSVVSNNYISTLVEGEIYSEPDTYREISVKPFLNKYLNGGTYTYRIVGSRINSIELNGLSSESISKLKEDTYYLNDFGKKTFINNDAEKFRYETETRVWNYYNNLLSYGSTYSKYTSKIGLISMEEAILSGYDFQRNNFDDIYGTQTDDYCTYLVNTTTPTITITPSKALSLTVDIVSLYAVAGLSGGSDSSNFKPTITLKSGTKIATGEGTQTKPYEVE